MHTTPDTQFITYLAAAIEPAVRRVVEETVREVLRESRFSLKTLVHQDQGPTAVSTNPDTEANGGCGRSQEQTLPQTGYLRLKQIIGDPRNGEPGLIPVSSSTWWSWCASGKAPPSIKLGSRTTVWRVEDIRDFIEKPR